MPPRRAEIDGNRRFHRRHLLRSTAAPPAFAARMNVRGPRPVEVTGYRLVRWLGTRGAASLYMATEPSRDRPAAIKIFHRIDAEILARLEGQLQENARLSHPNIVPIDAMGRTSDGRLFYAMPLLLDFEQVRPGLFGRSLRIAALLRDLLAGLDHAHRHGVVHGDIKPSNVLFDDEGHALLTDFGIARCMTETHGEMVNPQADLHDIGRLARELLPGAAAVRHRDATAQPAPPRQVRLPPGVAAWQPWFEKALADSPDRQFPNARAMADALGPLTGRAYHGGGGSFVAAEPEQRVPKWPLRNVLPIAAIIALLGWGGWDYVNESRTPDSAPGNMPAVASPETPVTPAASIANPAAALPISVAPPTTTLPAAPSSGVALADRVQALVDTGDALRAQGHLFSPPFHNAASTYIAALDLDPGNPPAVAGVDAMLRTLRDQIEKTWQDGRNTSDAAAALRQGDELAQHAGARARHTWRDYRKRLARHVGDTLARADRAHDKLVLAALQPIAKALHVAPADADDPAPAASVASAPVADTLGPGARLRDPQGPLLVYVPAGGGLPAFAIERVEVTRADYAAFVRATQRPAASCLAAHNPFSRLRHLTWRAPGFAQGGDHPVVCVSWDDAAAYTAWLSKTTGQPYRLPSDDQWLRAARGMPKGSPCKLGNVDDASRHNRLDDDRWSCNDGSAYTAPVGHYAASGVGAYDLYGNVSEWVAGGSTGSRPFRGISWRDGSHETPLGNRGTADADVGYSSVGFRVVRVIDKAHPAPPAAPGH